MYTFTTTKYPTTIGEHDLKTWTVNFKYLRAIAADLWREAPDDLAHTDVYLNGMIDFICRLIGVTSEGAKALVHTEVLKIVTPPKYANKHRAATNEAPMPRFFAPGETIWLRPQAYSWNLGSPEWAARKVLNVAFGVGALNTEWYSKYLDEFEAHEQDEEDDFYYEQLTTFLAILNDANESTWMTWEIDPDQDALCYREVQGQ
jgi:hypothetical protein